MALSNKNKKILIACGIIVACVIVGLVIWKMIVVH